MDRVGDPHPKLSAIRTLLVYSVRTMSWRLFFFSRRHIVVTCSWGVIKCMSMWHKWFDMCCFPHMDLLPRWICTWSGRSMLLCTWAHMWSDAAASAIMESVCILELMSSLSFFHFNSSRSMAPPHWPLTLHRLCCARTVCEWCPCDMWC